MAKNGKIFIARPGEPKGSVFAPRALRAAALALTLGGSPASFAQTANPALVIAMGDSIGEGVQAADAAWQTQVYSYASWVGFLRGAPLTIPYIETNLLGFVGDADGRTRITPGDVGTNVAVSGATIASLLDEFADAVTTPDIDSEIDLVLYPRLTNQMEATKQLVKQAKAVEAEQPVLILCWIGNNDALSAAVSFGNLDASQLTPLNEFEADFVRLADDLRDLIEDEDNPTTRVVFANIPDVTDIAFLVDRAGAEALTGFPVRLDEGHYTSLPSAILMSFFGNDDLLSDPGFVLDPGELDAISARIDDFNTVIAREAAGLNMPVVDINAKFKDFIKNPIEIAGFSLGNQPFGGLFSADGIHLSNTGHALIANEFIATINSSFGESISAISDDVLAYVFLTDPHIDKNGNGQVAGRLGVGLVETLMLLIGLSGDFAEIEI